MQRDQQILQLAVTFKCLETGRQTVRLQLQDNYDQTYQLLFDKECTTDLSGHAGQDHLGNVLKFSLASLGLLGVYLFLRKHRRSQYSSLPAA